MPLGIKIKRRFFAPALMGIVLSCGMMPDAVAQIAAPPPAASKVAPLEIKVGNHGEYARVVFYCPQLTAYRAEAVDGPALEITLDTAAAAKITSNKTAIVKSIKATPQPNGTLKVRIATVPGAGYKDFRFQNRIIFDIYADVKAEPKAAAAPKKEEPKKETAKKETPPPAKKEAAVKPPEENKPEAKKVEAPKVEEKKPEPVAEEKIAAEPAEKLEKPEAAPKAAETAVANPAAAPAVPAVPVAPVDTSPALSDPNAIASAAVGAKRGAMPAWNLSITQPDGGGARTEPKTAPAAHIDKEHAATITITSLSPHRLAVFYRFGALWVVTDAVGANATMPVVSGAMASFVQQPKVLRFKQGTAYRYPLPRRFYPVVSKPRNLVWQIDLLPDPLPAAALPLSADLRVQEDPMTGQVMLISMLKSAGEPLMLEDPEVGDTLYVVPTALQGQAVTEDRHMPEVNIVAAAAGMVAQPLKDGVSVRRILLTAEGAPVEAPAEKPEEKKEGEHGKAAGEKHEEKPHDDAHAAAPANDFIVITAPGGLAATRTASTLALIGAEDGTTDDSSRLFDFPNWSAGGPDRMQKNRQDLQERLAAAETPEERAGLLMDMAKLYFANNFGQEALGLMALVAAENPDIEKNPDFLAIRGAANAMSGHYKEALQDLSTPAIQQKPEVGLWIGYAAAATEQWRMADRSFPKSNRLLLQYPDSIAIPFTVYMAESQLRLGHADLATELLESINKTPETLDPQYKAAISYLRGIAYAQRGELEKAAGLWEPVANGLDRLYHAKASLSLARLMLQQKKITLKEAIDRVDSLRFAWRGDGLEVNILHTLGALKVQDGQVLSGLEDMKRAADLSDSLMDDSTPIRDDMKRIFTDLFTMDSAGKVTPLEMSAVYNEFSNLIPPGPEANAAALNYADSLIRMDLLSKAAGVMEDLIKKGGLTDEMTGAVGTKLTAVYLLDSKPDAALIALQETERTGLSPRMHEERTLLRARAQSQLNDTEAAIATLGTISSKNAQRLKADVLWHAQKWSEAAQATEALLADPTKPLSEAEASYVVNAAVAWKLAGNAEKLKEIRARYDGPMASTKLGPTFGVVTRDSGEGMLGDRETTLKIAGEVDMFKGFLESYKAGLGGS